MTDLEIHLLGQFQVSLKRENVSSFVSDKARALLAYLATEGHHPQRRETLAHLLWPNKTNTRARANLRGALANLRQAIGDSQTDKPYLLPTYQDIQVNISPRVWVDVDVLTHIHSFKKVTPENIILYDQILNLYQDDFLTGFSLPDSLFFDEWALLRREQYARMMDSILQRACDFFEQRGEYESVLPFAWRHVELEPWQERARRQLMRVLRHIGRRDEALQQYQDLEIALQSALKITPGAKTTRLYFDILKDREVFIPKRLSKQEGEIPSLPEFLQEKETSEVEYSETFVGRQDELGQMHVILDDVIAGRGSIVMVAGEAGSGKTVMIKEFIRQAQSRYSNLVSAIGHCDAFTGAGDPYLPFREILIQLSGGIETYWKANSFNRQYALSLWKTIPITCQSLLTFGPDLIDTILPGKALLAFTAAFSKTKFTCHKALQEHLRDKDQHPGSEVQQASLFSQFIAVLQKISEQVPLLLFLDDLQWADTGTIGALFQLIKHVVQSRILLVGAYRSEEVSILKKDECHQLTPVLHEIRRDYGDVIINLGLSSGRDFIQALIASEQNDLQLSFQEELHQLTGGNALFTIELLRSLQEEEALVKDESGVWVIREDFHLEKLQSRTEGVIAQRISRLPQNLKRILTLASIEGEIFTAEIIAAVEGRQVNQVVTLLSEQLVKQHRLVRPEQINHRGEQTISTYRFRHFLFQKYIYHSLDEIQRCRLHEQVGKAMEEIAGENKADYAVFLARHFHRANQPEKAYSYYALAGERAIRMAAYPEATNQFESALEMLLSLPENSARNEKELELQLRLGLSYQAIMGFGNEKVGKAYHRAWELCCTEGDFIKQTTTRQLLFTYYANIADFKKALSLYDVLKKDCEGLDEVLPVYAHSINLGYGYIDSTLGRHQSAFARTKEALKYYDQEKKNSAERLGMDMGILCLTWMGLHQTWLGYPEQARAHIQSIFNIAKGYRSKLITNDAFWYSSWISFELGDFNSAREYTDAALDLSTKEHYFLFEGGAKIFKGRILSLDGKHQEAIKSIQKGLKIYFQTGIVTFKADYLYMLAEIYCAAGQIEKGLETIIEVEQIQDETGQGRYKSALQRVKGDLYLLRGDEKAAEDAYFQAINIAQAEGTKLFELEAVKHLARLWGKQGKADQANKMLQENYDWFTEGFDTPMLVEARELLEDLAS